MRTGPSPRATDLALLLRLVSRAVVAVVLAGGVTDSASAQVSPTLSLGQATLEEFMDIRVTSAARKSQRAEDVAAAIFVITRDDIRRSGHATLPEVLRMAPGVQVAQVSASKWAISMRGFNDLYSNKLLVLVDGRSVYTRTFSGVFWDMQDLMLSDIERIEVIRGPGGASWGANAVNGVINVITRSSAETPGLAVDVSRGTLLRERAGIRYGGTFGPAAYRVYSQWSGFSDSGPSGPTSFSDRWHTLTTGVRTDVARGQDHWLAQGHVTALRGQPGGPALTSVVPQVALSMDGRSEAREIAALGRWTRTRTDGTVVQVQAYHTAARRDEPVIEFSEHSTDIDAQYETRLGARHGLVFGGGFRRVGLSGTGSMTLRLGDADLRTVSAFVQDEIDLGQDVAVTLGSKLEHDTFGGWGLLPSARVIWDGLDRQRVWASLSRARRTPAVSERDVALVLAVVEEAGLPLVLTALGDERFRAEQLTQVELGHRARLGGNASVDTTVFTGSYRHLRSYEPLDTRLDVSDGWPLLRLDVVPANLARARASGVEVAGHWTPTSTWRLDGSYSFLHLESRVDTASLDTSVEMLARLAPTHQWQGRTTYTPTQRIELTGSVSRTGELSGVSIPAYARADARAAYRLSRGLTAALVGQNLQQARHREYATDVFFLASSMPRSVRVDLRWEF